MLRAVLLAFVGGCGLWIVGVPDHGQPLATPMLQICADIVEVRDIFRDLGVLVEGQSKAIGTRPLYHCSLCTTADFVPLQFGGGA